MQALVGKTGKEGLKRRCLECEPGKLNQEAAMRAKQLFLMFGLDDVRDVSAGAATFYVWVRSLWLARQIYQLCPLDLFLVYGINSSKYVL